jgi:hypothetical protein
MGGIRMSAEIVQFIRRPKHDREQTDFPTIAFRSTAPRDITMDHADATPHEFLQPDWYEK